MTTDLRTKFADFDGAETYNTSGGALATETATGLFYETTGAQGVQFSNSNEDIYVSGLTSTDLSDTTCYGIVKDNLVDSFANVGLGIVIGDGTDIIGYSVAGNDANGMPLPNYFYAIKLDVSIIVATPGTNFYTVAGTEANLDQTAITQAGYTAIHLSKANGNSRNCYWDAWYYGANDSYHFRIDGGTVGTPITTANVVSDDITNGYGMVSNPIGSVYYFMGPTEWGEPTANANVYFTASDETWIWLGDNGGGRAVDANHFIFRIVGNATDTIDVKWTNISITSVGAAATFTGGDTNVNVMQLDTVQFTDFGPITFTTQSVGSRFVNDCTFSNCGQVAFSSMDADGCVFNGSTDALGAVEWSTTPADVANQDNFTFNSDGTGHAIEINLNTASLTTYNIDGYTFDGYAGQDGTAGNRVFYIDNALDGDVTINLSNSQALNQVGTGSGFSYELAAGYTGTVTIVSTVTLTLTGIETDSEVVITNLDDTVNFDPTLASSEQISGSVQSVEVANGGTGYSVNDTLTAVGGTGTAATFNVDAVSGGVVTAVSIVGAGSYTANPPTPTTTTVSPAGGSGCTLNLDISGEFSYSYDSGNLVDVAIVVFHLDFVEVRLTQTLSATSQTIPIQQRGDRVYSNP